MKQPVLLVFACIGLFAGLPTYGKESGEKSGTADINIGVGELQETKSRPNEKLKQPAPVRPRKPGAGAPGSEKIPAEPAKTGGNPDRPLVGGSVPNREGQETKPSRDMVIKGKKILQN